MTVLVLAVTFMPACQTTMNRRMTRNTRIGSRVVDLLTSSSSDKRMMYIHVYIYAGARICTQELYKYNYININYINILA